VATGTVLELEDDLLEAFPADGLTVPLVRLTDSETPPPVDVKVGEQAYHYERSYPIKGHSAVMPGYLKEQVATGKKPLLIERPDRFYVYFSA